MTFKLSDRSYTNLHGVNPKLIQVIEHALTISPIDFGIPKYGGLRTAEDQYKLFQEKATTLDGYKKKSYHQSGNAVDVFAYVGGRASWDENHLTTIAAAMLESAHVVGVPLYWGGHWRSFKDMPHFETR